MHHFVGAAFVELGRRGLRRCLDVLRRHGNATRQALAVAHEADLALLRLVKYGLLRLHLDDLLVDLRGGLLRHRADYLLWPALPSFHLMNNDLFEDLRMRLLLSHQVVLHLSVLVVKTSLVRETAVRLIIVCLVRSAHVEHALLVLKVDYGSRSFSHRRLLHFGWSAQALVRCLTVAWQVERDLRASLEHERTLETTTLCSRRARVAGYVARQVLLHYISCRFDAYLVAAERLLGELGEALLAGVDFFLS